MHSPKLYLNSQPMIFSDQGDIIYHGAFRVALARNPLANARTAANFKGAEVI
jgi:hypothetical protein